MALTVCLRRSVCPRSSLLEKRMYLGQISTVAFACLLYWVSLLCAQAQTTGGYMASRPGYLAYLKITQNNKKIAGYLQQVYKTRSSPGYDINRDDIVGTVSDRTVMLKIGAFLGQSRREMDGEYRNGKLYLNFPSSGGEIVELTFSPTSIDILKN